MSFTPFWKVLISNVLSGHHLCRTIPDGQETLHFSIFCQNVLFSKGLLSSVPLPTFSPMAHDSLCILLSVLNNVFLGSTYSSGCQPRNTFFCVEDGFRVLIESSSVADQFKLSLWHAGQVESLATSMTMNARGCLVFSRDTGKKWGVDDRDVHWVPNPKI